MCRGKGIGWRAETSWITVGWKRRSVRVIIDYSFMNLDYKREKRLDFVVQIVRKVLTNYKTGA